LVIATGVQKKKQLVAKGGIGALYEYGKMQREEKYAADNAVTRLTAKKLYRTRVIVERELSWTQGGIDTSNQFIRLWVTRLVKRQQLEKFSSIALGRL
jgi:hypothetical protein